MRRLAFVLTLALAAPLWAADPPVARLSGPKAVEVGSPIVLNPSGSVAPGGLEFGIARGPGPAPVVTLKSDDGQTVIGFGTAAAAGTYEFYVVAWGENVPSGRPIHSFAFWTVDVGTVTPPAPPAPPVPPAPDLLGLVKASRDGAARVAAAVKTAEGVKLAQAHRNLAADITAASVPWPADPTALANAVLEAKRVRNRTAVADPAAWAAWSAVVDPALQALYTAGRIKTVADWKEALTEIASGLEG